MLLQKEEQSDENHQNLAGHSPERGDFFVLEEIIDSAVDFLVSLQHFITREKMVQQGEAVGNDGKDDREQNDGVAVGDEENHPEAENDFREHFQEVGQRFAPSSLNNIPDGIFFLVG